MTGTEGRVRQKRFLLADLPAGLALFTVVLALFSPSLPYAFLNLGDQELILQNAWLPSFSLENIAGIFVNTHLGAYQPLTLLSYMIDYHLVGIEPWGFRFHNVILHGLCSVLLFAILRTFRVGTLLALLVAGFFALHPLRLEAVVWISSRNLLLSGFFSLLGFFLWRVSLDRRPVYQWLLVGLATFSSILAMISWVGASTLPLVLLLHDIFLKREAMARRAIFVVLLSLLAIVLLSIHARGAGVGWEMPIGQRLTDAAWSPLHYTITTIAPVSLSPVYPYDEGPSGNVEFALQGWLFCIGVLVLSAVFWRKLPAFSFGILAFVVVLAPASGLVPLGGVYVADRYSHLPSAFLMIAVAVSLEHLFRRLPAWSARAILPTAVPIVALYAGATISLMPDWRSSEALWNRVLEVYPESRVGTQGINHARLTGRSERPPFRIVDYSRIPEPGEGTTIAVYKNLQLGDMERAAEIARTLPVREERDYWLLRTARRAGNPQIAGDAIAAVLDNGNYEPRTRAEAAKVLYIQGDVDAALEILETVRVPTFTGAALWGQIAADAWEKGDAALALEAAGRAIRIHPAEHQALTVLARHHLENDPGDAAIKIMLRGSRHPATTPETRLYTKVMQGRLIDAMGGDGEPHYQTAFDRVERWELPSPEKARLLFLASTLAIEAGRSADAVYLRQMARQLDPNNPEYREPVSDSPE